MKYKTTIGKRKVLLATLVAFSSHSIFAQSISERLNLPEWTRDLSASIGYTTDTIDVENTRVEDINSQGVSIEVANSYKLPNGFLTQSALGLKLTDADEEIVNVDNKMIGLTQRIIYPTVLGNGYLMPSLGLGAHVGGLEYFENSEDQNYFLINAEAKVSYNTTEGIAPYIKYSYGIGDLEDTSNELELSSLSAGVSVVF